MVTGKDEWETLSDEVLIYMNERDALQAQLVKMQEDFERKEPRLYTLKQELRYLREVEQLVGSTAKNNSDLKLVCEHHAEIMGAREALESYRAFRAGRGE